MADEKFIATPASPVATPAATEAASSVPAAPTSTMPATVLSAEPVVPAAEPVAPAEVTPEPVKPAEVTPEPAKPAEVTPEIKPAEEVKPADAKKEESSQSAEPAPLPTYESFKLADDIKLEDAKLGDFTKSLGEFERSSKADHAEVQKFGQSLVDRYTTEVKETVSRVHDAYQKAWIKQTEDWKQAFINDPEIGGNRQETTVAAANEFITTHGGTVAQQAEFRKLMQETGLGNHPAMIRIFANAKKSPNYREGQPLAAKPAAVKLSGPQRMYGVKNKAS